jgi:hypothetical protein
MQTGKEITGWLKHMEMTATQQNYIHLRIDSRLFSGNIRYLFSTFGCPALC